VRLDAEAAAEAAWPAPAAGPQPPVIWPSPARPALPRGGDSDHPEFARYNPAISVSRGAQPESDALTQMVWVTDRSEDLRVASRAAGEALQAGEAAQALAIYREILVLLPDERSTLLGAAAALRQLGQSGDALHIYRQLLDKNPYDRFVEVAFWGLLGEQAPHKALTQLKQLAWRYPDDGRVRAQIGLILARQGQLDRAIAELQVASRLDPANPRYRADLIVLGEAMARVAPADERAPAIDALSR
jgi:tetratricopeptide (TPR) repeat protein